MRKQSLGLGFGELPSETISKNFNISDKQFDVIKNRKLFYDPELANLDAAKASGRVDDFNRLNRVVKGKQSCRYWYWHCC